jgi:hypothetical protein
MGLHFSLVAYLIIDLAKFYLPICDTQFPKGREIEDYSFFSLFSLSGPVQQGFGTFRKHSLVKQ